ncbi:MAG TPA: Hsp20/alpha crystallin family protein [Polyangiales bacterium]
MNLARRTSANLWDPFRELQEMSDRFNRMFQLGTNKEGEQSLMAFDWAPAVNISETEKAFVVKADLPEVKKEDVKITHENGVLTIQGERRQEKRDDGEKFHRVESSYGRFMRRFTIPEGVAEDRIEAVFKDGSLSVTIPKTEPKQLKSREIQVG